MVRVRIHHLGEHVIDNMVVSGPNRLIIMTQAELFLATCQGTADEDLDYLFARYLIDFAQGQGEIIEWKPNPPQTIQ